MTYAQVVTQVKRMSHSEKLALMKVLADTLAYDFADKKTNAESFIRRAAPQVRAYSFQ